MKFFFVVGEDSGDSLAASLITELKAIKGDNLVCMGVGGPLMKKAGFDVLLPMDQIAIIGIWEVIPKIPRLYKLFKAIVEEIVKQKPDAVITVDFPDFNFFLAKALRKKGLKTKLIHYVAPSVWAWRPGRAKKIASFLDGIICLFPMEPEYFLKHKLKAVCVGHPLVESNAIAAEGRVFREANDIPLDVQTLGLFFGSRESELKNISSALIETASLVDDVEKNIRVIIPTLPKLEYNIQQLLKGFGPPVNISSNLAFKWETFKACDIAVAVSGTVALELAYAGIPHVILYKTSLPTYLVLKLLVKVKHVHLANILLQESVVPEFIQGKCDSEKIAESVLELIKNKELQNAQKEKFMKLREMLGSNDDKKPSRKAAEFVLSFFEKSSKTKPVKPAIEQTATNGLPAADETKPAPAKDQAPEEAAEQKP